MTEIKQAPQSNKDQSSPIYPANLPFADVLSQADHAQNRTERTKLLAISYCSQPDLIEALRNRYGYSPEKFADMFASAQDELFHHLPNDYDLEFSIQNSFGDIQITNWIVSKRVVKDVEAEIDKREIPSDINYRNYFEIKHNYYNSTSFPRAGYSCYTLRRIQDDPENGKKPTGVVIEELFMELTHLSSREEMERNGGQIDKIHPAPLRWKDGSKVNISDAIRRSEEHLIGRIGKDQEHTAILLTTPTNKDGETMLARQGYSTVDNLSLPSDEISFFRESPTFERGMEKGYRGKVIFIPQETK